MATGDVAAELVRYGCELERAGAAQAGATFSENVAADALLERSPNAFLIGLLFTQGIPAERAWAGPYLLGERLGTLDLELLSANPTAVREAFQQRPMLHRFKETIPRWVTSAAARLLNEYQGDASRVWAAGSHVIDVTERLSSFEGIGRKKAVMGVEILMRHFDIDLAGREYGQVAYDVQVRRVFLRSGLVARDDREEIEAAAAAACPQAPGTLDLAAWLIGRQTCRPRHPLCDICRLGDVCPRLVERNVEGVAGYSAERKSRPERNLG